MKLAYDLHIHSCLSPCGAEDMTPANIAGMAMLAGLQVIAVADHNSCLNCPAVCKAAERLGLLAVPAMELTTAEEVHVLCLLPDLERAAEWSAFVREKLPDLRGDNRFFGPQMILDSEDHVLGQEERLLASASEIGIYDVHRLVAELGGIALPAHIDRSSFSLLSNLGLYDPEMGFTMAEVSYSADRGALRKLPGLETLPFLSNSDAHDLFSIRDASLTIEPEEATPAGVIAWLSAQRNAQNTLL